MTEIPSVDAACEFEIQSSDVNGPLNLEETIFSAQTSEPAWLRRNDSFTDIEEINGIPVKYTLRQQGSVDEFLVKVSCIATQAKEWFVPNLNAHLNLVLGLQDDLCHFYEAFADPKLSRTFVPLRGLRLMRAANLYESLVLSMLSQNNSAILMNRSARLLMKRYGRHIRFPDGTDHYLFPSVETVAKLKPRELRRTTSIGYRAKPVIQVSRMIASGDLRLEQLKEYSYDKASEILLELPGVGPKVSDCFLLYGLGNLQAAPVDIWIHRIVTKLYFRGRRVSRPKTAAFLRDKFGDWAGYAQLYLFDFARKYGTRDLKLT